MNLDRGQHHHRIVPRNPVLARLVTEPYELLLSTGIGLYGVILVATRQTPVSLRVIAPHWAILVWGSTLALAGFLTVVGMFRSKRLELAGNLLLGSAAAAYAVVVLWVVGVTGLGAVAFIGPVSASAFLTAHRIVVADRIRQVIEHDSR